MQSESRIAARRATSLAQLTLDRVAATPDREAFRYPNPAGTGWTSLTWAQAGERVSAIAAGLLGLGIGPEERVAIVANTRVEWILADLGTLCAGAATTTVYPSTQPDEVGFILADSGSVIAFVEDAGQLAKLRTVREQLPHLRAVVMFEPTAEAGLDGVELLDLATLERRGRERLASHPRTVTDSVASIGPEHLATLIYTSGTTGRPKGVRLVHDCWTYEGNAIGELGLATEEDLLYLWLPLSHAFGKVLIAAALSLGFTTAVDGRIDRIMDNLGTVRPTIMTGAPRIFEKVYARVAGTVAEQSRLKQWIFRWAFGVGLRVAALGEQGRRPRGLLALRHVLADRLVFRQLRSRFGGRMKYFVSGSAPLQREIVEWFSATGVLVLEGYGLTETSAVAFVNIPRSYRFGTVGPVLPGCEVRLAEDGEVMLRGPNVMRGYHGLAEQTAETLEPDGWLHSGDIGELLPGGFLRITDRKKDMIKTSGGKFVAPQPIEVLFKALAPLASQMVVHGDGRNYCTALITLDPDELSRWAQAHHLPETGYAALTRRTEVRGAVADAVTTLNQRLNRWETIKDFRILDHDLSVDDGELTPSLKMKRRVVSTKYKALFDEMYAAPVPHLSG